jgi:Glyoxalase-like domain
MNIQPFPSEHFELDHIFICTDVNAPAAQRLIDFGLLEGRSNTHPGQGTTNRCFFFQNAMLELLWVHDPVEAQTHLTQPTRLWERWRDHGLRDEVICAHSSSPFGIALRPMQPNDSLLPFAGWHYKPTYLPNSLAFWIGDNSDNISEPMLFYLSFAQRKPRQPLALNHPIGFRDVTALRLHRPNCQEFSSALKAVTQMGIVSVVNGSRHLIEIGFDGEKQGRSIDFSPDLPLIFHW